MKIVSCSFFNVTINLQFTKDLTLVNTMHTLSVFICIALILIRTKILRSVSPVSNNVVNLKSQNQ